MGAVETIFLVCAVFGGVLFVFRLVLQFLGGDTDAPPDIPHDISFEVPHGVDAPHGDAGMAGSDTSFKIITFQGITAFLMMFGLVGLAMKKSVGGEDYRAVIVAAAAGAAVMYMQAKLMTYLLRLQSSGTINMRNALGQEGLVYLTIPREGTGKAQVVVQNSLKIFDAIAAGKEEIPTGERVKVVAIAEGNVLVVERAGDAV